MPNRDQHLAQAAHNARFYESFDKATYSDWAATALFYTGLQYIDAFLATRAGGIHPGRHAVRDNLVNTVTELRPIAVDYLKLKSSSETARYFPPARFPLTHVRKLERVHLSRIATELRKYVPIS